MIASLQQRFAKLERQKQALLARLAQLSPAALTGRPSSAAWSAAEIVDHLHKTEDSILSLLAANLAQPPATAAIKLRDRLGATFLITLFRLPTRVKVPASAAQVLPAASPDYPDVLRLWDATRTRLADTLETVPPTALHRAVFQHPVSGWMNTPRTLDFLASHLVHHGHQLDRLKSARL